MTKGGVHESEAVKKSDGVRLVLYVGDAAVLKSVERQLTGNVEMINFPLPETERELPPLNEGVDDMKDAAAPAKAVPASEPLEGKEAIYVKVQELVKKKTEKNIGKSGGRELFDLVVENVFASAIKDGTIRFNAGFGSLHLRDYKAGSRRLPSGKTTQFGTRHKVRYEEGVSVGSLVKAGGDLEKIKASA